MLQGKILSWAGVANSKATKRIILFKTIIVDLKMKKSIVTLCPWYRIISHYLLFCDLQKGRRIRHFGRKLRGEGISQNQSLDTIPRVVLSVKNLYHRYYGIQKFVMKDIVLVEFWVNHDVHYLVTIYVLCSKALGPRVYFSVLSSFLPKKNISQECLFSF